MTGCSKEKEPIEVIDNTQEIVSTVEENEDEPEKQKEDVELKGGNLDVSIDYDFLLKNHEILEYNICETAYSLYDHPVLNEALKEESEYKDELDKEGNTVSVKKVYFKFDFNDDGLEDYLVCFEGSEWMGTEGSATWIYISEEDGSVKKIFKMGTSIFQLDEPNGYAPVAILNEKENGYYSFVLPWTENRTWGYNKNSKYYVEIIDEYSLTITSNLEAILADPIEYDVLSENHEILEHDICETAYSVYDHPILKEVLKEYLELDEELIKKGYTFPAPKVYFIYDFNDDGLDDYLVCFNGFAWSGSRGNSSMIYISEEDGSVKQVFSVTARIFDNYESKEYAPVAVLNEKVDGYYSIVFPWTRNRIWSYSKQKEWYVSVD